MALGALVVILVAQLLRLAVLEAEADILKMVLRVAQEYQGKDIPAEAHQEEIITYQVAVEEPENQDSALMPVQVLGAMEEMAWP